MTSLWRREWRPRVWTRASAAAVLVACALAGCQRGSAASAPAAPALSRAALLGFQGHIRLDSRSLYENKEGDVWQYLFYQDGSLFDAMVCYPRGDRCELLDLRPSENAQAWSGVLSESVSGIQPFLLSFALPPGRSWRDAQQISLRVTSPELGEVGATTLNAQAQAHPPEGLRERLRGEQRLRALYAGIAQRYAELLPMQRVFPASHADYPPKLPCGPTVVSDRAELSWLGLSPPAVLSWSFSVESDAARGALRLVARRDRDCRGATETLVLTAKLDEYGDLKRADEIQRDLGTRVRAK